MKLDSRQGARGILVDDATGCRIPFAIWADFETGYYEAFRATPDGKEKANPLQRYRGRAEKLKLLPLPPMDTKPVDPVESKGEYKQAFEKIWRDRGFSPWWIAWRWQLEILEPNGEYLGRICEDARAAACDGPQS